MADRHHRRPCPVRKRREGRERSADIVVAVGVDRTPEERDQRVDDNQSRSDLGYRPLDGGEVVGNGG